MIKKIIIRYMLGILIILAPTIITGRLLYAPNKIMGGLLIAEFIMRTTAFIIGLLVIYDTTKS